MPLLLSGARRHARAPLACALSLALGLLLGLAPARAATDTVTDPGDNGGAGQLRQVIGSAAAGDTVVFAPGVTRITLTQGQLNINKPLTVQGTGAGGVVIDANHASAVLSVDNVTGTQPFVNTNGVVALSGLSLVNGVANGGAGVVVNFRASATLANCVLSGNSTNTNGEGGGLYNYGGMAALSACAIVNNSAPGFVGGGLATDAGGTTTLSDCTVSGNSAGQGGGLYVGGSGAAITVSDCAIVGNSAKDGAGLSTDGNATLSDCIVVGNVSSFYGGGVFSEHTGNATITGCTFTGNSANDGFGDGGGGGVECDSGGGAGLTNDILYGDADGELTETNGAYFTITDTDGTDYSGTGNFETDPQFITPYNAKTGAYDLHLKAMSPCINAGTASANGYLPTDIDGRPRPTPPNANPSIGAYEAPPSGAYSLVVENAFDDLPMSLRTAVQCADDYPSANITFDAVNGPFATPQTITLSTGQLTLSQTTTITGPSAGVAVDGGHTTGATGSRVFDVLGATGSVTVTLRALTIQHGYAPNSSGGGVVVQTGRLSLFACALAGNVAQGGGAVEVDPGCAATLIGCTVTGNSAPSDGGLLVAGTATLSDDILYGDSGGEIGNPFNDSITATHCDIGEALGPDGVTDGGGNFDADPLFVTPYTNSATPFDLRLQPDSPCVGAGVAEPNNATDITGRTRTDPPTVGAYEGVDDVAVAITVNGSGAGGPPVPYNQSVPVVVTVSSAGAAHGGTGVPGGTVDIDFGDGTPRATGVLLTDGTATVSHTFARLGQDIVNVTYNPSPQNFTRGSGSLRFNVQTSPTLAVSSSLSPSVYGQSVTLTATFSGASQPTGDVTFKDGATVLTTRAHIQDVNGVYTASYTTSTLGAGGHSITAVYNGDNNNAGATSPAFNQHVNPAGSSTAVSVNNGNAVPYNTSVPVKVTVSNTSGTGAAPTGTVKIDFGDGTAPADNVGLVNGTATVSHMFARPGRDTVQVQYNPAPSNFQPSSGSANITVGQAMPTLGLGSSLNPSVYGQLVTFTATLSGAFQPSGPVTFKDGATTLTTTAPLQGGPGGVYTATFTTRTLGAGPHTITAVYNGDPNNAGATSPPLGQSVTAAATTTTLTVNGQSSVTVTAGGSVTFRVTVADTSPNSEGTPGGTVTIDFGDGSGSGPLTLVNRTATTTHTYAAASPAGSPFQATVSYSPDATRDFQAGAGGPVGVTVNPATVAPVTVSAVAVTWGGGRTAPLTAGPSLLPAGRNTDVPWAGVSSFTVTLSATPSATPTFTVTGQSAGLLSATATSQGGGVYLVSFPALSSPDTLTLTVSGSGVTGFQGTLPVLPGDISGDGAVNAQDMVLARNAISAAYSVYADINGDGVVDMTDYNLVRARVGTRLP